MYHGGLFGRFHDDEPEYDSDYMSEIEFARSEGFDVDDDGHWVPIEDDDDFEYCGYDDDDDDDYESMNEADFARDNGFELDEDGHWIPM